MAITDFYKTLEVAKVNNISDGLGGFKKDLEVIKNINGVIKRNSNKEIKIAEKLNNISYYYLYTNKNSGIDRNMIIKDNDKYYRVTSLSNEAITPNTSTLDIEKFDLERYEIN